MLDSLEDWMEQVRARPHVPDLVEELIPSQPALVLLAGRTGIGKTNLALQLAFSVATGDSHADSSPDRQPAVAPLLQLRATETSQ